MTLLTLVILFAGQIHAEPYYFTSEEVEICEAPANITHVSHTRGSPYFLNYGSAWPNSYLTIVIWERDISELEINPYRYFKGNQFCMKGKITTYNNRRQLVIRNPSQLINKASN
jgi:hypothetical protein